MFRLNVTLLVLFLGAAEFPCWASRSSYPSGKTSDTVVRSRIPFGPPCSKEFLFFEFTTTASPEVVKWHFKDVNVRYRFKVIGACHYIFVVENDHSEYLKQLTLPEDACFTLSTFPVEPVHTFFSHLGIPFPDRGFGPLIDRNLTFVERIIDAEGWNEDEFKAAFAFQITQIGILNPNPPRVDFVAVATFPNKFLFIWERSDCDNANFIFGTSGPFGGPGHLTTRVLKLQTI